MKYLLLLILLIPNFARSATLVEKQERTYTNLLQNAGFENGVAKWTPSVSATVSQVTGSLALIETKSLLFTATAASQTIQSALYALPTGLVNGDCESSILYKTNSSVYSMRVLNASGAVLSQQSLPAVSSAVTAKMFFPCSVNSTTSLRSDLISSATASGTGITWDQNHLGSLISLKNGAIISQLPPYTPALTGVGTAVNQVTTCYREGPYLKCEGSFTTGTATAATFQFGLPSGLNVATNPYPVRVNVGFATRNAVAPENIILALQGRNFLTMSNGSDGVNKFTDAAANAIYGTGEATNFNFKVLIEGWASTGTTFDSVCPNDISCQNIFTAKVSLTGVVTDDTLDFINGNCTNANPSVCTFNTGIFTVAPTPTGTVSSTSTTVTYTNTSGFTVNVQKQGADFKAKVPIEGFMSKTVTSNGSFLERMVRVKLSTTCSASPCTIASQSGDVTSVTRSSAGVYQINFLTGTFSATPTCTLTTFINGAATGGQQGRAADNCTSATSCEVTVMNLAAANTDGHFHALCMGPR